MQVALLSGGNGWQNLLWKPVDFCHQNIKQIFGQQMKAFILRVKFALQGWVSFFRKEANGQIQLFISVMVIVAGFALRVSITEWMILLSCIGVVISLEMINSAIEKICNHVNPQIHPSIKVIKDVAAGAVLWASIIAAIIGLLIFIPRAILLF